MSDVKQPELQHAALNQPELILHHFLVSPFSEKIRLVLGYKQLAWKSVLVPGTLPKPDVVTLTGGYRKSPFLQIGADIYCDSALICDVLERLQPSPTLYPDALDGIARTLAQWADGTLFWSALAAPRDTGQLFAGMAPGTAAAFGADREAMKGTMLRLRGPDAAAASKTYLRRLSNMFDRHSGDRPFLLGQSPCIADFSVYHTLWFSRRYVPDVAAMLMREPLLACWMERMAALGHGPMQQVDANAAIAAAAAAQPLPVGQGPLADAVFQDDHGIALGSHVRIAAESFGPEASEGELVAATSTHFSLRRHDARAGTVHVHFPRIGYVLEAAPQSAPSKE